MPKMSALPPTAKPSSSLSRSIFAALQVQRRESLKKDPQPALAVFDAWGCDWADFSARCSRREHSFWFAFLDLAHFFEPHARRSQSQKPLNSI
jgi:hypothetical protein